MAIGMTRLKRTLTIFLLLACCCGARAVFASTLSASQQAGQITTGKVIEKIVCAKAPAQSYALYVPSSYTPTRTWPILYAFDPGARGPLAVNRFREAAEKYGWIVVA